MFFHCNIIKMKNQKKQEIRVASSRPEMVGLQKYMIPAKKILSLIEEAKNPRKYKIKNIISYIFSGIIVLIFLLLSAVVIKWSIGRLF